MNFLIRNKKSSLDRIKIIYKVSLNVRHFIFLAVRKKLKLKNFPMLLTFPTENRKNKENIKKALPLSHHKSYNFSHPDEGIL